MRILHLNLKRKWWDLIASGEKLEEYRDIKPYWVSRLVKTFTSSSVCKNFSFFWKGGVYEMDEPEHYDVIEFRNGYSKNPPTIIIECVGITNGYTKLKWADEYKPVFIIKLGKIISIKNYK